MVIVTGPNQELAIKMIRRIKAFFKPHGITFDSKETVVNLNGCEIKPILLIILMLFVRQQIPSLSY
jgi:hypothetical protein